MAMRARTDVPYVKYSFTVDFGIITAFFRLYAMGIILIQKIIQTEHIHRSPRILARLETSALYGRFQAVQIIEQIKRKKLTAHTAGGTFSRKTRVMEREYFLRIEKK